jgi:hypothetical protein
VHLFSNYQHHSSGTAFMVVFRFLVPVAYEDVAEFYHLTAEPAQAFLPDSEELECSPVLPCFWLQYHYASHSPNRKSRKLIAFIICGLMLHVQSLPHFCLDAVQVKKSPLGLETEPKCSESPLGSFTYKILIPL